MKPQPNVMIFKSLLMACLVLMLCACLPPQPVPVEETPTEIPATKTPDPTPQPSPSPIPATATAVSQIPVLPQNLRGIKIQYWHPWTGDLEWRMISIGEEFNRTNIWGVTVEVKSFGGDLMLHERLLENLNNNSAPQVAAAPTENLLTWQAMSSKIVDLAPYIQDGQWGLTKEEISTFPTAFWQQDQTGSQLTGIPAYRSAQALFYNQSWAESLGFSKPPQTPQEFKTQACAAAQANLKDNSRDNDGTGGWIVDTNGLTILSWLKAFGAGGIPATAAQPYGFNNDAAVETITFLRAMIDGNCAWFSRDSEPFSYFGMRQALFYTAPIEDIGMQERMSIKLKSSDRWSVIPFPGKDQKPVVVTSGLSYAILKSTSAEQLAAWLFIRFLILPRNQAQMVEGSGSLPLSTRVNSLLSAYKQKNSHWAVVEAWGALAQSSPGLASWRLARPILEDAAWQSFQSYIKPAEIPTLLEQLDATILEVIAQKR